MNLNSFFPFNIAPMLSSLQEKNQIYPQTISIAPLDVKFARLGEV